MKCWVKNDQTVTKDKSKVNALEPWLLLKLIRSFPGCNKTYWRSQNSPSTVFIVVLRFSSSPVKEVVPVLAGKMGWEAVTGFRIRDTPTSIWPSASSFSWIFPFALTGICSDGLCQQLSSATDKRPRPWPSLLAFFGGVLVGLVTLYLPE